MCDKVHGAGSAASAKSQLDWRCASACKAKAGILQKETVWAKAAKRLFETWYKMYVKPWHPELAMEETAKWWPTFDANKLRMLAWAVNLMKMHSCNVTSSDPAAHCHAGGSQPWSGTSRWVSHLGLVSESGVAAPRLSVTWPTLRRAWCRAWSELLAAQWVPLASWGLGWPGTVGPWLLGLATK